MVFVVFEQLFSPGCWKYEPLVTRLFDYAGFKFDGDASKNLTLVVFESLFSRVYEKLNKR